MGWQRIKDKNLVCKKIVDEINNQKLLRTKSACQAKKLKRVIKRYKRSCNGSEQKLSDRKAGSLVEEYITRKINCTALKVIAKKNKNDVLL